MNISQMRHHAEHCLDVASQTDDEIQRARFLRAARMWRDLAHYKNQIDVALLPGASAGDAPHPRSPEANRKRRQGCLTKPRSLRPIYLERAATAAACLSEGVMSLLMIGLFLSIILALSAVALSA